MCTSVPFSVYSRTGVKVKENVFYHPRNQKDILHTLNELTQQIANDVDAYAE
jgi:hypothetical protein